MDSDYKLNNMPAKPIPAPSPVPVAPPANKPRFAAALAFIDNRGRAPLAFLEELVAWGKTAPAEIFAPNVVAVDAYAVIKSSLATRQGNDASGSPLYLWESPLHRRAAMLELMRVHAGRESSWNWGEGVDKTNARSQRNRNGEETGIFQVSFDSTLLGSNEGKDIMGNWLASNEVDDDKPETFIPRMKTDHTFAMEFYARLVRVSIAWAGPLLRHGEDSVYPYLKRDSMRELQGYLK